MQYGTVPSHDVRILIPNRNVNGMVETAPLIDRARYQPKPDSCINLNITMLLLLFLGGFFIGIYLLLEDHKGLPVNHPFDLVGINYWGTNKILPEGPQLEHATSLVLFHTASMTCSDLHTCSKTVRQIQLESNPDAIAYNFLIGGDGLTYEGRGFNLQSGFNLPNRNVSLTVGIIGDFTSQKPSKSQLDELEALIRESVLRGKLAPNFTIHGARNQSFLNDAEELFKVSSKRFDKWHSVIYL